MLDLYRSAQIRRPSYRRRQCHRPAVDQLWLYKLLHVVGRPWPHAGSRARECRFWTLSLARFCAPDAQRDLHATAGTVGWVRNRNPRAICPQPTGPPWLCPSSSRPYQPKSSWQVRGLPQNMARLVFGSLVFMLAQLVSLRTPAMVRVEGVFFIRETCACSASCTAF